MMSDEQTSSEPASPPALRRRRLWIAGGALALVVVGYAMIYAGLPSEAEIKNYRPGTTAKSAAAIDWSRSRPTPIRVWVPLSKIAKSLQQAVIISEDDTFYQHDGVNFQMMRDAFLLNWRKGRYVRGASTISMQLARNAFLTRQKTLLRKIREIILTRRMEKALAKNQILELYLNVVEWGENVYGIEAAAHYYFGKPAASLSLSESALLASLLPNPIYFNPFKRPASCRRMQMRVLNLMLASHSISPETYSASLDAALYLRGGQPFLAAVSAPVDSVVESQYPAFYAPAVDTLITEVPLHVDSVSSVTAPPAPEDTLNPPR